MLGFDSFFQRDDDSGAQIITAKSKTKSKIKKLNLVPSINQKTIFLKVIETWSVKKKDVIL